MEMSQTSQGEETGMRPAGIPNWLQLQRCNFNKEGLDAFSV